MKLFLKSVKICEICGLKHIFDQWKPLFTMEEGIRGTVWDQSAK